MIDRRCFEDLRSDSCGTEGDEVFYWIYDIPLAALAALFLAVFVGLSTVGVLITRPWSLKTFAEEEGWREHVVITLEGAFVFFGLLLALVTIQTYENFRNAREGVALEAAELGALYRGVSSYPQPIRGELQEDLNRYVTFVINEAWPQQARGIVPVGGVPLISEFQKKLTSYNPVTQGEIALHGATLFKYNDFIKARRLRLHSVTIALPAAMWAVLFAGTLINIGLSCLLPVESLKGHLLLSGAFASVVALILFIAAAMDNPYRGAYSVSPEAFEIIQHDVMGVKTGNHEGPAAVQAPVAPAPETTSTAPQATSTPSQTTPVKPETETAPSPAAASKTSPRKRHR